MEVDKVPSMEERLAQAMIDLRKGYPLNNVLSSIRQRRDYLVASLRNVKKEIEHLRKENEILRALREKTEFLKYQLTPIHEFDGHLIPIKYDTRNVPVQTEPVPSELCNLTYACEKYKLINYLKSREIMLKEKLRNLQLAGNHRETKYMLLKLHEYNDLKTQIAKMTPNDSTTTPQDMEIVPFTKIQTTTNLSSESTSTSSLSIENKTNTNNTNNTNNINNINNSNNRVYQVHEESDDEGVQLLLSMKRNVLHCKCGKFFNSITDWDEHQSICSKATEKAIGEQCQLCKKTFLTCVALNIHSTKKHNKKKVRTDSVMHCPCGMSFTAKWRQNCVHKLNSHGRHCKAFKDIETQCSICKKGFIDRKSLEYHGLKAHKLAVPVSS